ncbi:hypothetical protein [Candidatus Ichthyocystis sparus]|uniref:hypothetical protein n=1 Tax=Candidatus Ichthyocystis sparus TaxID=1561004 RepID=UPI00159EDCEF|nr:hypothetical protein [Candidatus Ichthyocystis sparus]
MFVLGVALCMCGGFETHIADFNDLLYPVVDPVAIDSVAVFDRNNTISSSIALFFCPR